MLPRDTLWYFAYGSNMSPAIFTARRGIRPLATRWGWLPDHRLCFDLPIGPGERGCANVAADPGARIAGVLYCLTPEDAERLDRTEGVPVGVYRRIPVEVAVGEADAVAAFTYQSALGIPGRRPSARYLGLLLEGARAHGLPPEYIAWLEGFDLAFDERGVDGPLEGRVVRFYFAYDSPDAFVSSTRLAQELGAVGVMVEYKPVYVRTERAAPDMQPSTDGRHACLGFLFASAAGRGRAYHDAVCAARLHGTHDVDRPEALAAVAERAGLDPQRLLAALDDPRWGDALAASDDDARADAVSGLPFFVFRGEHFCGDAALESVAGAMRSALSPSPAVHDLSSAARPPAAAGRTRPASSAH
jgi:2-hydroxychromene-2-carboxylate isomerase